MRIVKWSIVLISLVEILGACQGTAGRKLDTPTGGAISIAVDETLKPLLEAEEKAFEGLYQQADLKLIYAPEARVAELLLKDSVRTAILCRKLDLQEEALIRQVKVWPSATKIASDAIALIVHPDNPDTLMSHEKLQAVLMGELTQWKELGSMLNSVEGGIQLVFDHEKSSTLRFLKDSLGMAEGQPHFFALEDNQKVLDYVARNKQAMGVIGLSWISDSDDPEVQFSLEKIKVLAISAPQQQVFYQPYQGYVAQGVYPLAREVYVLSREARSGLGSGFTAFLANEKGQRIILKAGLLPATMPVRLVQVAEEQPAFQN